MVAELLDGLRAGHGGCQVVAYADLSARMVLVSSTDTPRPREDLDALCKQAAETLSSAPMDAPTFCDVAICATPSEGQLAVFLRLPSEPSDALCCICAPDIDLGAFVPAARACLADLGETP